MSPHHTYLFLGFSATRFGDLPWFQHVKMAKKFPLKEWKQVRDTVMMGQFLSNEAPRRPKAKRKHA
jgi:hypothetical protein